MTEDERNRLTTDLVNMIFHGLTRNYWLYWPPGPMTGQVFDRKRCTVDVKELIEKSVPTEVQA